MANSWTLTKETSNVLSLIYRASKNRNSSKADNMEGCREYGKYLGVLECDINLICDTIKENKKADLYNALEELVIWYRDMDKIAQGIK